MRERWPGAGWAETVARRIEQARDGRLTCRRSRSSRPSRAARAPPPLERRRPRADRGRARGGRGRRCATGRVVYGVTTGFGQLSSVRIDAADAAQLQVNLLRSHAVGSGEPLDAEIVRGMVLLLASSLRRGHSGVRVEVVELLLALLERGVVPVIPSRGSVGSSGDLAPLAHLGARADRRGRGRGRRRAAAGRRGARARRARAR